MRLQFLDFDQATRIITAQLIGCEPNAETARVQGAWLPGVKIHVLKLADEDYDTVDRIDRLFLALANRIATVTPVEA